MSDFRPIFRNIDSDCDEEEVTDPSAVIGSSAAVGGTETSPEKRQIVSQPRQDCSAERPPEVVSDGLVDLLTQLENRFETRMQQIMQAVALTQPPASQFPVSDVSRPADAMDMGDDVTHDQENGDRQAELMCQTADPEETHDEQIYQRFTSEVRVFVRCNIH